MKKVIVLRFVVPIAILLALANCVTLNRFDEFQIENRVATAQMLSAPPPEVFTSFTFWIDPHDPIGSAARIGSGLIEDAAARKAQERMDRALGQLDLGEIIRIRTLEGGAKVLRCQATDAAGRADLLFNIAIREYGIDAQSGQAGMDFRMDVQVELLDTRDQILIWRRRIQERKSISPSIFGLDAAIGNVLTAVALSQLTEEQMVTGFSRLAEDMAESIVSRLHKDYIKARYR